MFTIGITGGIGAGKTTASTFFQEKGAFVFNADKESKSYLKHTVSIQHKLINAFGNQVTSQSKLSSANCVVSISRNSGGSLIGRTFTYTP